MNAAFQGLNKRERRKVLNGEWKLASWRDIATDAGFGKLLASDMYQHLCGYAHSSSLSVLQIKQSLLKDEEQVLVGPSMSTINILTANLIHEYCELYSRATDALNTDPQGKKIVEKWIHLGASLDPEVIE